MSHAAGKLARLVTQYLDEEEDDSHSRLRNAQVRRKIEDDMIDVFSRNRILFGVDIEAWERNTEMVTEIGLAIYDPRLQRQAITPYIETHHIIIQENMRLRNGRYVPDHTDNCMSGVSHILSQEDAVEVVQYYVDQYFEANMECLFVAHGISGDLKWLVQLGVELPDDYSIIDTQQLYARSHTHNRSSLKNALRDVKQPYAFLHNAANDAYYTVILALRLCDPQIRRLTQFDERPFLPSWESRGQRLNKDLAHNKSMSVYTTADAMLDLDCECDFE